MRVKRLSNSVQVFICSMHSLSPLLLSPVVQRRSKALAEKGLLYVGCGVSGGEEGARYGPSLMPGGDEAAWCVDTSHIANSGSHTMLT